MESRTIGQYQPTPRSIVTTTALLVSLGLSSSCWSEMDHSQHMMAPEVDQAEPAQMQGHEHHEHHHHPMPTGTKRMQASYSIPDVTMIDQQGNKVSVQELMTTEEPLLVNFIYTTCTAICPVMSATFQQVQRELGSDSGKVRMVSISIDPEQDTPSELANYAKRFNAGPQWQFLTGTLEDSIALQRAFDTYRVDKMNHAPVSLLRANPASEWIRYEGFASASDLAKESRAMITN